MILFTIIVLVIYLLAKQINWVSVWYKQIITQPYNYLILIGLLIIGFFTKLDYTNRFGCIISSESIFSAKNILFSSISISLIFSSFVLKNRTLKLSLVLVELLFWLFKLFYFKGGYIVSVTATPDPIISFYDTSTLALRLFIISGLLSKDIKTIYILIITMIIMTIKVFVFPTQLIMKVETNKSFEGPVLIKKKSSINGQDTVTKVLYMNGNESDKLKTPPNTGS